MKLKKPKRRPSHNQLVEIVWDDAASKGEMWADRGNVVRPIRCATIGYEVERTARHLTVAQTIAKDGGTGHQFSIPAGMIHSVKRIRRA